MSNLTNKDCTPYEDFADFYPLVLSEKEHMALVSRALGLDPAGIDSRLFEYLKENLDSYSLDALMQIEQELSEVFPSANGALDFGKGPFALFCQFSLLCLTDSEFGAIKHVKNEQLQSEIAKLVQLCAEQNTDRKLWSGLVDPIMNIAMGDAGGKEARAADFAYGIAKTIADFEPEWAGRAARKMLRLATAEQLHKKLAELIK